MYLDHFGLTEAPFRITPHTGFFFAGANRGATLEALLYAITRDEGIVKISGEVGSGKTMLCRVLMERLPENVVIVYLANPSLSRDDILYALADELGIVIPEHSRSGSVMRILQETLVKLHAEGKQVVVLIDEAHAMPKETLEEIRLLSNLETHRHKLLQLVLFGQPELDDTLLRDDMRQLRERITHHFILEPLVRDDTEKYLDFRMRAAGYRGPSVFTPAGIRLIAQASRGLTRRINILADKALLAAFAGGGHQVGTPEARAAVHDAAFDRRSGSHRIGLSHGLWWAAGGAAAATMIAVAGYLLLRPVAQPHQTQQADPAVANAAAVTAIPAATPASTAVESVNRSRAPSTSPVLDRALASGKVWLDRAGDTRWFIQLHTQPGSPRIDLIEEYLLKAIKLGLRETDLHAYHIQTTDFERMGIIYGDYDSQQTALMALDALPPELKLNRPYVRKSIRLKP